MHHEVPKAGNLPLFFSFQSLYYDFKDLLYNLRGFFHPKTHFLRIIPMRSIFVIYASFRTHGDELPVNPLEPSSKISKRQVFFLFGRFLQYPFGCLPFLLLIRRLLLDLNLGFLPLRQNLLDSRFPSFLKATKAAFFSPLGRNFPFSHERTAPHTVTVLGRP